MAVLTQDLQPIGSTEQPLTERGEVIKGLELASGVDMIDINLLLGVVLSA